MKQFCNRRQQVATEVIRPRNPNLVPGSRITAEIADRHRGLSRSPWFISSAQQKAAGLRGEDLRQRISALVMAARAECGVLLRAGWKPTPPKLVELHDVLLGFLLTSLLEVVGDLLGDVGCGRRSHRTSG